MSGQASTAVLKNIARKEDRMKTIIVAILMMLFSTAANAATPVTIVLASLLNTVVDSMTDPNQEPREICVPVLYKGDKVGEKCAPNPKYRLDPRYRPAQ
jgi:hypothetical protein